MYLVDPAQYDIAPLGKQRLLILIRIIIRVSRSNSAWMLPTCQFGAREGHCTPRDVDVLEGTPVNLVFNCLIGLCYVASAVFLAMDKETSVRYIRGASLVLSFEIFGEHRVFML